MSLGGTTLDTTALHLLGSFPSTEDAIKGSFFYLYIFSTEDTLCAFKVTSRHKNNLFLASDLGSGGDLEFCAEWPPGQGWSGGGYSAQKAQSISIVASSTGDTQHGPERREKRSLELLWVSPFYPLNCISVCFLLFKTLVF